MQKQYETVLIFTPVLNEGDTKKKIKEYTSFVKEKGYEIVEEDLWGMRQLAYPIKKKTSGIYFVFEYKGTGEVVDQLEVMCRRDTDIIRFLTVKMDKYHIKYNEDKRNGLVGRNKKVKDKPAEENSAEEEGANDGDAQTEAAN